MEIGCPVWESGGLETPSTREVGGKLGNEQGLSHEAYCA